MRAAAVTTPWIFFVALPLCVAPWFLDFAQEAKSLSLLAVTAALLGLYAAGKLELTSPPKRVPAAIILLALLSVLGSWFAPASEPALLALRNEGLGLLAALLIAATAEREQVPKALHAGAAVVALLGILQVLLDYRGFTPTSDPGQFPGVTFGNRGLASLFVALGVLPGLALWRKAGRGRPWIALGLACQVLFVLVAMTRAVWIGLALALVATFWLGRMYAKRRAAVTPARPRVPLTRQAFLVRVGAGFGLMALVVAGLVIISGNDALTTLLKHRLDPDNWLQNPRLALWSACWTQFSAASPRVWLLGFGAGSFQVLSPRWLEGVALGQRVFLDAHNDPLQYLIEYGALGLGLRAALILAALRGLAKAAVDPTRSFAGLARVYLGNALILLVASLFFYPLRLPYFIALFGFFLIAEPAFVWRSQRTPLFSPSAWSRLAAAVLAAAILGLGWQRIEIEAAMRAYVKDTQPFFVKMADGRRLSEAMRRHPVPYVYFLMVEPRRLRR